MQPKYWQRFRPIPEGETATTPGAQPGSGAAVTPPATTAPAAGGTTPPPTTPADAGTGGAAPHVNHAEVVEYGKRVQKLEDRGREDAALLRLVAQKLGVEVSGTTPATPPGQGTPQQGQDRTAAPSFDAQAELALRDALSDAGIVLTKEQRAIVTKLFNADGKPADVEGFVKSTVMAGLGYKPASAQTPAPATSTTPATTPPPTQASHVTATGAPSTNGTAAISDHLPDIPLDVWRQMSPEQQMEAWNKYEKKVGGRSDRFARKKKA